MSTLGPLPLLTGLLVVAFVWAASGPMLGLLSGYAGWGLCAAALSWRRARVLSRLAEARTRWDAASLDALASAELPRAELEPGFALQLRWERCVASLIAEDWTGALQRMAALPSEGAPERLRFAMALNTAWCQSQMGETAAALAEVLRLGATVPRLTGPAEALHAGVLGGLLVRSGRPGEAVLSLERALREAPGPEPVEALHRFHLAEAFLALGRIDEARREYERAAAVDVRASWVTQARTRLEALDRLLLPESLAS